MTTTFDELVGEVARGETVILVNRLVGPSQVRMVIFQRADGAIWQATDEIGTAAWPWSLTQLEFAYQHCARLFNDAPQLDAERLYRWIAFRRGADEAYAAIEAAQYIVRQAAS